MENACESGALRNADKHCAAWRFASDRRFDAVDSHDPSGEMKKPGLLHIIWCSSPDFL